MSLIIYFLGEGNWSLRNQADGTQRPSKKKELAVLLASRAQSV